MDFIKKLLSSSRFDTILVIVDWLTKQAIFIPTYNTIMCSPNMVFLQMLLLTEAQSLCQTSSDL